MDDQTITQTLLFTAPQLPTTVGILLGGGSASGEIAREAAFAYKQGFYEQLILSGGNSVFQPHVYFALMTSGFGHGLHAADFFSLKREADYMAEVLKVEGIPEEAIVFAENKSTNTAENFQFIAAAVAKFQTATIVTLAHNQLRALGTAAVVLKGRSSIMIPQAVYPFGTSAANWTRSPFAKGVRAEALKIDPKNTDPDTSYVLKKFCVVLSQRDIENRISTIRALGGARPAKPLRPKAP